MRLISLALLLIQALNSGLAWTENRRRRLLLLLVMAVIGCSRTGTRVTETEVDGTEWSWIVSDDGWFQGLYILKWLVWSAYSVP